MKLWCLLIGVAFIVYSLSGCEDGNRNTRDRFMILYEKPSLDDSLHFSTGITEYEVKFTNLSNEPVVVPFTYHRWLPISQSYTGQSKEGKIVEIRSRGTTFHRTMGIDTLNVGETQRYFVKISNEARPDDSNPIVIISFDYYYLSDFAKSEYSTDYVRQESFILWKQKDSFGIYETDAGFDPHVMKEHSNPRLR